ncbi:hypothetical protein Dsin_017212 [Dipteronia sinensis]|uniref:Reverse transcriptase zinc-binding domain-containing protein n=1 Tax=Dipteronia sinensis TaxID=43782 RepID=A0AAE0AF43_9ROSI|nr:hypothetical protein Dsin_032589 [Dipteronia sinensis]KAK3212506.1 hypothetical protein Dsin_017212 [Dipteronia sinensis]
MIFSPLSLSVTATVNQLKLHSGKWNIPLVKASFLKEDSDLTLYLHTCSFVQKDMLLWHFDKLGHYSNRSWYQVGTSVMDNQRSSVLSDSVSWWKTLWRLQIPSKIKLFVWKACHQWIPTLVNLANRKVHVDGL